MSDQLQFAVMAETGNREIVEKFFQAFNAGERDRMESWLDAEYVWEMPQSGERVRGAKNNREMIENYPGLPKVETRRSHRQPGQVGHDAQLYGPQDHRYR